MAKAGDAGTLRRRWDKFRPALPYAIAAVVVAAALLLLSRTLATYRWDQVVAEILSAKPSQLIMAGTFAALSYFCLTWFDWLALRYVGHRLPYRRAALASFTSLSLGHNIGFSGASSGAIRYRFYARWGLNVADVAKLVVFCGMTVALGLVSVAGLALLWQPELGAAITGFQKTSVTLLAVICLALPVAYAILAAAVTRPIRFRKWSLQTPPLHLALSQIGIGTLNYLCVAGCLYSVLRGAVDVSYFRVASAYVIANVAAILSHVPGGLGVLEAALSILLPGAAIMGGLVMFRIVYYLIPLALGLTVFGISEFAFGSTRKAN